MALYYCISDVLDKLESESEGEKRLHSLIPVCLNPPDCTGYPEDTFTLGSSPKLMDLRNEESAYQLAQLVEDVPLYGINLELVLDQALCERHKNVRIENALNQAFGGQPLPNTLRSQNHEEDPDGGLRHPMLGHLDKLQLCEIYITFLRFLDRDQHIYNFERTIMGKHMERFLERYDGYATETDGKVKAGILVAFGSRMDHDPGKPMENPVHAGQKLAQRMRIDDPQELLWAWLEADHYQMRRCRDIDRLLRLSDLPRMPNWIRTDIFCCIEKEAMKQVFAETMADSDSRLSMLDNAPSLKKAVIDNAEGEADPLIEALAAQRQNLAADYSGAAREFADGAQIRMIEAKKAGIG